MKSVLALVALGLCVTVVTGRSVRIADPCYCAAGEPAWLKCFKCK